VNTVTGATTVVWAVVPFGPVPDTVPDALARSATRLTCEGTTVSWGVDPWRWVTGVDRGGAFADTVAELGAWRNRFSVTAELGPMSVTRDVFHQALHLPLPARIPVDALDRFAETVTGALGTVAGAAPVVVVRGGDRVLCSVTSPGAELAAWRDARIAGGESTTLTVTVDGPNDRTVLACGVTGGTVHGAGWRLHRADGSTVHTTGNLTRVFNVLAGGSRTFEVTAVPAAAVWTPILETLDELTFVAQAHHAPVCLAVAV
jgi:hypothetical protein